MYAINITLKYSPMPLSVERKEVEEAEAVYQKIIKALCAAHPHLVELTCEKQPEKKIAVFSDQISAVILSQNSGPSALGKTAGFYALAEDK